METKKPKLKYVFLTGETVGKRKKKGFRYCGKGEIGELKFEKIDGEKYYYIDYDIGRSNFSKYRERFKEVEYWVEDIEWRTKWVEKKKPKKVLVFNTKIKVPEDRMLTKVQIKLGKKDDIHFFDTHQSNIIRDLQLKEGDKIRVTIERINS